MNKTSANPRLKARALTRLNKFPRLKQRLKNIYFSQFGMNVHRHESAMPVKTMGDPANLTPRARQIYLDLKNAIEKNREAT